MNFSSFQKKQKGLEPSSASAPAPRNKGEYNILDFDDFRVRHTQTMGSLEQTANWTPSFSNCGQNHLGRYCNVSTGYFKCVQEG